MTATAPLFGPQPPVTSATVAADQKAAPSPVVRVPMRPANRKERRRAAALARRLRALAVALVIHWLTTDARALDCSTVTYAVGAPLTADAAECLRRAVVRCELDRDTCEAHRAQQQARADACEATSAITCPPAPLPVVPVLVAFVAGAVAVVALLFAVPR